MGRVKLAEHFYRDEFACRCGCGFDTVDSELISVLAWLRGEVDEPVRIDSGCRCPKHNRAVGGRPRSQHLLGRAADIRCDAHTPSHVYQLLDDKFPDRYGLGVYATFVHIDTRSTVRARWTGMG